MTSWIRRTFSCWIRTRTYEGGFEVLPLGGYEGRLRDGFEPDRFELDGFEPDGFEARTSDGFEVDGFEAVGSNITSGHRFEPWVPYGFEPNMGYLSQIEPIIS